MHEWVEICYSSVTFSVLVWAQSVLAMLYRLYSHNVLETTFPGTVRYDLIALNCLVICDLFVDNYANKVTHGHGGPFTLIC